MIGASGPDGADQHRLHPTSRYLGTQWSCRGLGKAWDDLDGDGQSGSPSEDCHLHDLVLLRRVRDRIDRDYAQPLNVEALARGANMSAGHLSRQFRLSYGESPYSYLMTRRIERAMALLDHGGLSVTDVCFAVGCSSLGTFSSRFAELVGVPPSVYRRQGGRARDGMVPCVARQVTRPIRNRSRIEKHPSLGMTAGAGPTVMA